LSCALLERLEQIDSVQRVELTCYENDDNILELLSENLQACQEKSKKDVRYRLLRIIILQASIWILII